LDSPFSHGKGKRISLSSWGDPNPLTSEGRTLRRSLGRRGVRDAMGLKLFHHYFHLRDDRERRTGLKKVVTSPTESTNFM